MKNLSDRSRERAGVPQWLKESFYALLSGSASLVLAVLALRISFTDMAQRWTIGGDDQILHYLLMTSSTDASPFAVNPEMGFPNGMNLLFTTQIDVSAALGIGLLALVIKNGVVLLNVFYLLTFFTAGVTGYAFFRALRVRPWISIGFAIVFALVPYHFQRLASGHGFLANYWAIPLIGILILIVAGSKTDPLAAWADRGASPRSRLLRRLLPIVVLSLAIALTGSYYFVFAVVIVGGIWLATAIGTLLRREKLRTLLWPTVATGLLTVFVGLVLGLLSLNFGQRYAPYFSGRLVAESELYAGKLSTLLLPWTGSGLPGFDSIIQKYLNESWVLTTTESPGSSVIASLGIVALFAAILILAFSGARGFQTTAVGRLIDDARTRVLATAFLWAFLFYIVTGLGVVVALMVGPQIRAWARMSIILVLLGLALMALIVDSITSRFGLRIIVASAIFAIAAVDQLAGVAAAVPLQPVDDTEMRQFVASSDDLLPDGCGVVQLPLKSFPDSGPIGEMHDYDQALPYLFTEDDRLRWSYGSVGGTYGWDIWKDVTGDASFETAVEEADACAIEVDLNGYSEDPDGWKSYVEAATGTSEPAVVSSTGRYLLFPVEP